MADLLLKQFREWDVAKTGVVKKAALVDVMKVNWPHSEEKLTSFLTQWGGETISYETFVQSLFEDGKPKSGYKVAFFSSAPYDREWFAKINADTKCGFELKFFDEPLNEANAGMAAGFQAVCVFVNDPVDAACIKQLKKVGVETIALRCAGFDRVHLETAEELGITVARVPAYSPYAVAEHAITLMMTLNRRVPQAFHRTIHGNFSLSGLMGQDMYQKRVGVIGTGLIGSISARILKLGFECDVVAYDAFPNKKISDPQPEGLGIPYVTLDELFATCDMITLHAPLLPATKHTINAAAIAKMKPGVLIVNTSRGPLIDTDALVDGLKKGIVGGAGLDVVENEGPYFFLDWSRKVVTDKNLALLMRMPNVIVTAHQAFFTEEAMKTISNTTLMNIKGVQDGTGPPLQNGKLVTVCKPAPKAAAAPTAAPSAARAAQMEAFPQLETKAQLQLAEKTLPPIENKSDAPFKVALFSATPDDIKWFDKVNQEYGTNLTFIFHTARLEEDTAGLAAGADAVCIFVNDDASAKVVEALAALGIKIIALRCAGFNNVDLKIAKEKGITVARVPAYSPHAVAEHAVALALSVNRRIPQAFNKTRSGDFTLNGLLGRDLGNAVMGRVRVGIIGTGLIGSIAAKIWKSGFDCDVVAYDKFPNKRVSDPAPDGLGIPYVELEELFKTADVISLHAPLLPGTKHIINQAAIKMMKPGIVIVNTSRGGLIDTKALIWGLQEGIVAEAGLDVVEGEDPYFFKDCSDKVLEDDDLATLLSFNNVTITAHQAFFTMEAMRTICHTTISNLTAVRNGAAPPKQSGKHDTVCLPPAES